LAPENVFVTTLHPGMVNTEFFAKEKANQDMATLDKNPLTAEQVAEEVYNALFTKQKKIIIPAMSKSLAFLQKYLPGVKDTLLTSMTNQVTYNKSTVEDEPSFSYVEEVK
jgi:short-subunit dehydrogenase